MDYSSVTTLHGHDAPCDRGIAVLVANLMGASSPAFPPWFLTAFTGKGTDSEKHEG